MRIGPHLPWPGNWSLICSRSNAGSRTSCLRNNSESPRQLERPSLRRKDIRIIPVRRLPGPAVCRLSEGVQTPEAHSELFRDWQKTQTQSSVRTLRSLRPQMDVRSCGMQGPPAERQPRAAIDPDRTHNALSRARTANSCFSLDKDWVENRVLQAGVPIGSTR
jgi:hypothetical protein